MSEKVDTQLFTPHHYNAIAKGLREHLDYEARIILFWPLAKTFLKYDPNFNLGVFAMRLLPELPDFISDSTN